MRPPVAGDGIAVVTRVDDEADDDGLDVAALAGLARRVLVGEGVGEPAEMTLLFVDEATIADLNRTHLVGEGPTDVLSFPIDGETIARGGTVDDGPVLVGDVVICPAVARRNAGADGRTLADELALLVVHGCLHLLGWDHDDDDEAVRMRARERHHLERGGER